jgi:hypothetical protein
MTILTSDSQAVGETVGTLFSVLQQGPIALLTVIKNVAINTMNYRFQEWNGTAWVDLGASGSDFYNTLSQNEVKSIKVTSNFPQVRMIGNASGGAELQFDILRYVDRASGGPVPILNL